MNRERMIEHGFPLLRIPATTSDISNVAHVINYDLSNHMDEVTRMEYRASSK